MKLVSQNAMRLYLELPLIRPTNLRFNLDLITIKYKNRKNYAIRRISYLKRLKRIDEAKNGILVISTKTHARGSLVLRYRCYGSCIIQSSNLMDGKYFFSKIALTSRRRSTYARITAHDISELEAFNWLVLEE